MHSPSDDSNPQQQTVLGKRMIAIAWIFALFLLTLIFGSWEDSWNNPNKSPESRATQNFNEVVLERNRYGHYVVTGKVNGQNAEFMLDTGATLVAIPAALEQSLGLYRGQSHMTQTANGTARAYFTQIDRLSFGEINLSNVQASIVPNMQGEQILMGMSVLKQLEFSQNGRQLTLRQLN